MIDRRRSSHAAKRARRGSVLLVALVAVMTVAALVAAMLLGSTSEDRERVTDVSARKALCIAEAGLADTVSSIQAHDMVAAGTPTNPISFGGGSYWTTIDQPDAKTAIVSAWGRFGPVTRTTQVVMERDGAGIYDYAVFAGNASTNPSFDLFFNGTGSAADGVNGPIYSGGNVVISGNAHIHGSVEVTGTISGGSFPASNPPKTGVHIPEPDVQSMDYAHHNDFDVAALFSGANYAASAYGGSAWQLPEASPAHIFRKNPSDRAAATAATVKDDYFLEDPYEPVNTSASVAPGAGSALTVSGLGGEPGPVSTDKLFFIDGNLWVHNQLVNSFTFANSGPQQVQVTFVVKGNIYFTDNLIYQGTRQDGIAFIAMKDASVADSGNIVIGDPAFGTAERIDAFLYAEENLVVNNSAFPATTHLTINGNLTAGNSVQLLGGSAGAKSQVTINHDNRVANSDVTLPGLAGLHYSGVPWAVRVWREVAPGP